MKVSTPKVITFVISLVLVLVGILAALVSIPALSPYALWIVVLGYVVLAGGVVVDGM
jgi:hypothetical protein